MGPHTLVIKRGEYGAILFREDGHFMVPGYLLQEVFEWHSITSLAESR